MKVQTEVIDERKPLNQQWIVMNSLQLKTFCTDKFILVNATECAHSNVFWNWVITWNTVRGTIHEMEIQGLADLRQACVGAQLDLAEVRNILKTL